LPEGTVSEKAIDAAIFVTLSGANGQWRKVAFIVGKVAETANLPDGDESLARVAKRIAVLVKDGRLVAQGDIRNWRSSEVRLPAEN
jgi:hypothetical protein